MFFELIEKRRSIRKFKSTPVEKDKVKRLVESALRAPSSRGFNPWRFIVVDQPELLEKLSKAKPHGSSFMDGAPLGIVVCGDETRTDVWVEDTSIATIYIQLAAEALDLGSCWIQIRKREHDSELTAESYIRRLLDIPEHMKVESMVALGYPDEAKKPHQADSLELNKVFYNKFDQQF
ncbi:NAD(P)H-dependent dehydrogenase/reductase [Desulfamplus magnetovallimortis]|uniref:NAD(P)H-dependent dehydrogenase/reductase n=1 Tax=Desulfamplus magnetovallimortis TaxID=1246637 RepID=A0A1W1HEJ4_9BACT|nr:nitroreductase family protein [Desulfamplus magnetovallimortis]SLM30846.1 NAD(P)H-dependent dehydrogenase/reductase [Desulfamplus magnetovallimortis]